MWNKILKSNLFYIALFALALSTGYWLGIDIGTKKNRTPTQILIRAKQVKANHKSRPNIKPKMQETTKFTDIKTETETETDKNEDAKNKDVSKRPSANLSDKVLLYKNLSEFNGLSFEKLQEFIRHSDKIIENDPDFYPAYKAKLLALFAKEIHFGKEVSPEEYDDLYDQMLQFEGYNDLDSTLYEAAQMDSPNLEQEQEEPDESNESGESAETGETPASPAELLDIDNDLIHLPFIRLSALHDIDGLADIAEEYIEEYPDSHIGYLYLAEALSQSGNDAEAFAVLKEAMDSKGGNKLLLEMFKQSQKPPMNRLSNMATQLIPNDIEAEE